jgi:hypothetical protein
MAALSEGGQQEITRAEYESIGEVSRSQAAYDLADLVKAGLLQRVGSGRSTRYRLTQRGSGRRRWTDDRIRAELREFCSGRERWPPAREFKKSGRADLYLATSRYGGVDFWAGELGFRSAATAKRGIRPRLIAVVERLPRFSQRFAPLSELVALGALAVVLGTWHFAFANGLQPDESPRADSSSPTKPALTAPPVARVDTANRSSSPRAAPLRPSPREAPLRPNTRAGGTSAETRSAKTGAGGTRSAKTGAGKPNLVLKATRGDSWLSVRSRSASGKVLFEGLLGQGLALRFELERLWIRLGAPSNLAARLNGKLTALPGSTATVLVSRKGIRTQPSSSLALPPSQAGEPAPAPTSSQSGPIPDHPPPAQSGPTPDPPPGFS